MSSDMRSLRKRCEARLREFDLPSPFDLRALCEAIAGRRNRPVRPIGIAGQMGACGLWVSQEDAEYVFYEKETSPLHQLQIILHELSHMICEHRPVPLGDACVDALLFPNLRPETIRVLLQRAAYSSVEECEAELLATLLLTRIGRGVADSTSTTDPRAREILRRLVSSFEDMGEGRPWARSSSATGRRC